MASIRAYRTTKGERRYEVRYRDLAGRQRSRAFTVSKDAQAFKVDIERRQQAGGLYQAEPEPFGQVADAWLKRYELGAASRVRPRARSIATVNEVLPKLDPLRAVPVDRLRRSTVEDLIAQIAAETPRRAEMALALLKRILRSAEERGQPVDASVFRVRLGRSEERDPCFLTWEQVDDVRSWMPEYICRLVPIAVLTMLRRGEILAVRDQDVDFEVGSINVRAQNQQGQRVQTETAAGRRTVDLGPVALRLLREQQLARTPNSGGLLFPSTAGGPFDPNNLNHRIFKPAARAAGFPELTFHDLRHTGASLMIAAGCHVKVIAEQMGHADGGALVLKRYGHLYKGAKRQAAIATESHVFDRTADSAVGKAWGGTQMRWDLQ